MAHTVKKAVVVYKKIKRDNGSRVGYAIAALRITKGALVRLSLDKDDPSSWSKNRTNRARVLWIRVQSNHVLITQPWATACNTRKLGRKIEEGYSRYNGNFIYRVGKIVKPTERFDRGYGMCESGIHFFSTLRAAQMYSL